MASTTIAPQATVGADTDDAGSPAEQHDGGMSRMSLRVATYNIEDVRTATLLRGSDPKLAQVAATLQRIRPDVLFLNEIAYDQENAPDFPGGAPGQNAQRFADRFLAVSQGRGLAPLRYRAIMRPSNTGLSSGLDLDNALGIVQTVGSDGYGVDCWGYGEFPGQYALAVLIREDLKLREKEVRTFQKLAWSAMPGALRPALPGGASFYSDEEWSKLRLSSKTHMDVPVELPDGAVLHLLASHPTPPSFDGTEDRNGSRNHDEIRFWAEYIDGASFIVDDKGVPGGLASGTHFVIAGDLNADPDEGDSRSDPMGRWLLKNPKINASFTPLVSLESDSPFGRAEDNDDTASFGYRVDYVLPSASFETTGGAVERVSGSSDHALVWIDIVRNFRN